jgi:hypothetical protein
MRREHAELAKALQYATKPKTLGEMLAMWRWRRIRLSRLSLAHTEPVKPPSSISARGPMESRIDVSA